jgi:hypothetical protein
MAKDKEKQEEDVAMTTGNDGEVKVETPEPAPEPPKAEKKAKKKTQDEKIMEVGMDVPVANAARAKALPIEVVNRAAIKFLAGRMTGADQADFKTAFPSLYE